MYVLFCFLVLVVSCCHSLLLELFLKEATFFCSQTKKPFDYAVQTTGDTWHFPAKDGNRWLCVRKAEN